MLSENLHQYYLDCLGIERWILRQPPGKEDDFFLLKQQIKSCRQCQLAKTRTQVVIGDGNERAALMIVGEAPGFYEDKQGKPFVGRAGQLLNLMLHSVGFERQEVYIANVIKCRPPSNRDPKSEEVAACTGFLKRQIQLIQPKMILALGRHAAHYLLNQTGPLAQLRKERHYYGDIPLMITYHPAYLLRNPLDKSKAYQDLLQMKSLLD